jgi:hypothetical protein
MHLQWFVVHTTINLNQKKKKQNDYDNESSKVCYYCIAMLQGLKVDISTQNKTGLLSKVTRVIHENGLSITRIEFGVEGETAIGSFYVTDCSGQDVNENIAELIKREIGGSVALFHNSLYRDSQSSSSSNNSRDVIPKFSIGSMIWSHLERLINNFRPIRS